MFIDDMNMPQVDTYGTQQPIALLKLLVERGGMYDRGKDLNWKVFKDVQFTAAMGKVGLSCTGHACKEGRKSNCNSFRFQFNLRSNVQ